MPGEEIIAATHTPGGAFHVLEEQGGFKELLLVAPPCAGDRRQ
jgi:hypothetical protein